MVNCDICNTMVNYSQILGAGFWNKVDQKTLEGTIMLCKECLKTYKEDDDNEAVMYFRSNIEKLIRESESKLQQLKLNKSLTSASVLQTLKSNRSLTPESGSKLQPPKSNRSLSPTTTKKKSVNKLDDYTNKISKDFKRSVEKLSKDSKYAKKFTDKLSRDVKRSVEKLSEDAKYAKKKASSKFDELSDFTNKLSRDAKRSVEKALR